MNGAPYRAWRFTHPDFAAQLDPGLRISPQGGIDMVAGDGSVRQAILLLLTTRPGERVMRPDYGCDLYQLAFWPNDDTTAGLAIHFVQRALATWEPRIEVVRLDAQRDPEYPERLYVMLEYRSRSTQRTEQLLVPITVGVGA
ncbi:MAG: GPW/gp25 family protein [Chloroflexota bacterium]